MAITAGVLSQVSVSYSSDSLLATAATAGTGPYTYQWYRSTTTGFSPSGSNIITGATALTLNDSGLTPLTTYYYKVIATDTGHSNDVVTYTQLAVVTTATGISPNQFAQSSIVGMLDQKFNYDTISVQVDISQATNLYSGAAVKIVDSVDGAPKVIGCAANTDQVLGFINFDIKTAAYSAGSLAQISMNGNVMYLYATTAIARGAQVTLDLSTMGGVASANSGDRIVGWAFDKAAAAGALIRVFVRTPSYTLA